MSENKSFWLGRMPTQLTWPGFTFWNVQLRSLEFGGLRPLVGPELAVMPELTAVKVAVLLGSNMMVLTIFKFELMAHITWLFTSVPAAP